MAQVDSLDLVVLTVLLVGSVAYFTKGTYWGVPKAAAAASYGSANGMPKEGKTRNIIEKMDETGKNCVVFFGSQTGTAEDYASRLAKEGAQRFGLKTMVADLEDYDFENLDQFPEDKVAFFVLATYGEGEPTDNAVDFYQFMTGEDVSFGGGPPQKRSHCVTSPHLHHESIMSHVENVYVASRIRTILKETGRLPQCAQSFIAPITESRELFTVKDRNCLHLDIGIQGSTLNYQTGDHLAVWPTNAGKEVDRFLQVFGLEDKRHTVVKIKPIDVTAKVPFPTPTTYDAAVRYYMEICGPVSRQFIATLAQFAPDEDTKSKMKRLGEDKDHFHSQISTQFYNIAQALQSITSKPFTSVPFSLLIEGISKLQPRYYSISSSSMVQKDRISITTVVESIRVPGAGHVMKGVTTNYLLALKQKQHGDTNPDPHGLTYEITGPRNKYDGIHVPVHVRHSNFKLPSDPSKPIIMVGPGTGVAPFRGFIQERVAQAERGDKVGPTVLFFGCRNRDEDFLYKDEWEAVSEKLGDNFKLFTAFSRESEKKVYVQHRLRENAVLVNELLKNKATFYVCGDAANMAREVNTILGQIISEQRGLPLEKGEEFVKNMRNMGMYQEDVWS
ncbi:NADPH-cytochrome P450 reductase [Coccidioides immitis RMSCC 3703]|uniref:NADPH--hemoprotein reductase n=1 Tax=Coccidioides immitis RMSCC 3703 TaxID=454286 RepID=A0A0J8RBQ1_COCIT|nr:NADPH-cytochrome P450 reductase [Coccidioides immitis RMSCC 3703]